MREWQVKRRERTRQLIELGGLVVKAGLVELADDDRAALYGAFLTVAAKLRGEDGANRWCFSGARASARSKRNWEGQAACDQAASSSSIRSTSRANSKRNCSRSSSGSQFAICGKTTL